MIIFSDKKQFIRISIDGVDVVCVIKKNTTSHDVIKMVMVNPSSADKYALFESSFGIEQRISDDTRITKLIKSWGEDKYKFSLVLRQIDQALESKIAESANRAKTRLRIFRALLGKKKKKVLHRSNTTILNNLNRSDFSFHEKPSHKNLREFVSISHLSCSQLGSPDRDQLTNSRSHSFVSRNPDFGKHELMRRYMIDVNQFYVDERGLRRRKSDAGSVSGSSQSDIRSTSTSQYSGRVRRPPSSYDCESECCYRQGR